ncbi:hypothetical protein AAG570_005477 [Ranatra chinensis]|uniref:Cytochrome P450 n=1 Tax=Ranatra chinensis TaxID=642074 RepID=A0ABD0XXJ8_9HEMI
MASKRRNMFHKNKMQETTEKDFTKTRFTLVGGSHPFVTLPEGEYWKKGHYSTRRSRGQRLLSRRGGFKRLVEEDREDTCGLGSSLLSVVNEDSSAETGSDQRTRTQRRQNTDKYFELLESVLLLSQEIWSPRYVVYCSEFFDRGTNVRGGVLSEALVAILCVVVVVWWGLFRWKRRHLYRLASQLPGPPTLPIFGNLFQLMFDPKEFAITGIKYCMNYPSPFRLWLGPFLYVVVHDPEDAQIVLTNSAALEKGVIYNTLKNTFGNGILTAPVQQWKKNRRLISPAFNTKLLEQFLTIFNRKNRLMVKLLEQETGKESFDVYSYCELMDLDVICGEDHLLFLITLSADNNAIETSLGVDIGAQTRHYRDFINAMSSASHIVTVRALNFWMHPDFIYKRTKLYRKEMRATQIIHQLPKSVIRQKREEYKRKKAEIEEGGVLEAEECGGERRLKNFLDILMGSSEGEGILSDEELLDEVVTMVLAFRKLGY